MDLLVNCARTCEADEAVQIREYINRLIMELKGRGSEDGILFCHLLYILRGYIARRVGYQPQDMYHTQNTQDTQDIARMVRAGVEGLIAQATRNAQPPRTYPKIIDISSSVAQTTRNPQPSKTGSKVIDIPGSITQATRNPQPLETYPKIIDMPRFMLINFGLDEYSKLMQTGEQALGEAEIYGKDWREQMMQTLLCNQQLPKGQKSQFLRILPDCLAWCIKKLNGPFERLPPSSILTAGDRNDPTWKATVYVFCFLWGCCFYDLPGNYCPWARLVLKGFGITTSEFLLTMTSMILTTVSRSHAGDAAVSTNGHILEEATRSSSPTALLTLARDAAVALGEPKIDLLDPFLDEYAYLTFPSPVPVTSGERRYMDEIFQYTREFISRFSFPDDLGYDQENPHVSLMEEGTTGYDMMN